MIINGFNPQQLNIRPDSGTPAATAGYEGTQGEGSGSAQSNLGLSGGDTLSGKIMDREGDTVRIMTDSGTEITARLDVAARLPVGSTIAFTVLNSDSSGVTLSPLLTNTNMTSPVNTALLNAGLSVTERNSEMVRSMMDQGMSIGRDEILHMNSALSDISGADIPSAVMLTHLGIEPSPDNIAQFDSYLNYEHQVSSAINEIIDMVPQTIADMISSGDTQAAIDMTRDMLDVFTDQGSYLTMSEDELMFSGMEAPVNTILNPAELTELTDLLAQNGIDEAFGQSLASGEVSLRDIMFVLDEIVNRVADDRPQEGLPAEPVTVGESATQPQTVVSARPDVEDIPLPGKAAPAEETVRDAQTPAQTGSGSVGLDFLSALKGDAVESKTLENALHTAGEINKGAIHKGVLDLIASKPLNTILKEAAADQWKLTPRQVGEDKQVEDLYKRITEQTNRLINALNEHTKGDTPLAQSMGELNKNMNFMNELNNMFNYVQLPMKLSEGEGHGELYVYSNKKHMASQDGTVSALLHLDMDHLGATDVYVTMNSSNHVNTHFYLPDDEALDLIAAHIDELNARIESRGYTCSAQMSRREEMTNVMEEIVKDNKSAVPVSISNFDARA